MSNLKQKFPLCNQWLPTVFFTCRLGLLVILLVAGIYQTYAKSYIGNCQSWSQAGNSVLFNCEGGSVVKIVAITPEIVRIRISPDGNFPESLPEKFGFVRTDWAPVKITAQEKDKRVNVKTGAIRIEASLNPMRLTFYDNKGNVLVRESASPGTGIGSEGVEVTMEMAPDEHFYGLGFQRGSLDARGRKLEWKRLYRMKEATMGTFLSTRGYGFYSNNTWRQVFDFTEKQAPVNYYTVTAEGGQVDYYLIAGPSFRRILDRYTSLTGRPWMVPRWALGMLYICRCYPDENLVRSMLKGFRDRDIPIDMLGLEPGWDSIWYGTTWKWHPQRFPEPKKLVSEMAQQGIKMEVWEPGVAPKFGYLDSTVRKNWYASRIEGSLNCGIKFFKQDDPYPRMIHSTGMEDAAYNDPLGNSGEYNPAETENLANSLYSETAMKEARRVTSERSMIIFHAYCASFATHRWPFSWAGDFAAGAGMLNAGLTGHAIASLDMQNNIPGGMHKGFLNPVSIIDAWAYYREPWIYTEPIEKMNRFYAKLKYRLIPYIYTTVHQASETGLPTTRAMIIDNEDNPELVSVDTQYMLGDWLLAGSDVDVDESRNKTMAATWTFEGKIYLPRGTWFNYWTGEKIESPGGWQKTTWSDEIGGPLFVKGGAIIPMAQVASYSNEEPLEVVVVDVYPSGDSQYTLYEDDGVSYEYEKGVSATTGIQCRQADGSVKISVGEREGNYKGMPERRSYLFNVHVPFMPKAVKAGGKALSQVERKDDILYVAGNNGWFYDENDKLLWIKPVAGWQYDYDKRGPGGDPERDKVVWKDASSARGKALELAISLPTEKEMNASPGKVAGTVAGIKVFPEFNKLIADGASKANVTILLVDANGLKVGGANSSIELKAEGEGVFENGSKAYSTQVKDGIAMATVTAGTKPGNIVVTASSSGLKSHSADIRVIIGKIELKANPPVRFKVGSWPPDNVTIYATVRDGDEIVKSYAQPVDLLVTGQPGEIKTDFRANARKGIATFSVAYKAPPEYVFKVTGPGLEPAQIKIY